MAKFIKLKNGSAHEYFNVSSVIGITKRLSSNSQTILHYETTESAEYNLISEAGSSIGNYIIEAVMNANSSSHTSNVYYPEKTQGTQPSILYIA